MPTLFSKPLPIPEHGSYKFKTGIGGPLAALSNFFACRVCWRRTVFSSAEHVFVFECLVTAGVNPQLADWACGGKYDTYDYLLEMGKKPTTVEYWRKRQAIGIVAKMVGNQLLKPYRAFLSRRTRPDGALWMKILLAKFQTCPQLQSLLGETQGFTLVEYSRSVHTKPFLKWIDDPWCGHVHPETGERYGLNWMGELLMQVRHRLFPDDVYTPWTPTATHPALPRTPRKRKPKTKTNPTPKTPKSVKVKRVRVNVK